MPLLSINELHRLTGHSREHLRRSLEGVAFQDGPRSSKMFESRDVLTLRVHEGTATAKNITEAESRRLLNIEKTTLIRVQQESLRKVRIPIEDTMEIAGECFRDIRGIIMASKLDEQSKDDILTELCGAGTKIKELGTQSPH